MPVVPGRRPAVWKAYYWCRVDKKQKWVPAEVTRAWDGLEPAAAEAAFDKWTRDAGIAKIRSRRRSVFASDELSHLVDEFMDEYALLSPDTSEATKQTVASHLLTYVQEYFVREHGQKDVRAWWEHTPGFTRWLRKTYPGLSVGTVKKIGQSLRRFGEYLVEESILRQPWRIKKVRRAKTERAQTPLPRAIPPEEVLYAAGKLAPDMALVVLLGYFTSLRPGEVYGLEKADFITGLKAKKDAKTHDRFAKLGLGSGLSVSVTRARMTSGLRKLLKTSYSYGIVNCWSAEGAAAAAKLVRELPDGPLFGEAKRQDLDARYKAEVMPLLGVFLYDLRRASGLYLGRTRGADIFLLQDHLRHAAIATTLLYTRRPLEEQETADTQDFNDVG